MHWKKSSSELFAIVELICIFLVTIWQPVPGASGRCASRVQWVQAPLNNFNLVQALLGDSQPCIIDSPRGYPVPGAVSQQLTVLQNGKTVSTPCCIAASPFHPMFNSTTYKVLINPSALENERGSRVAINNPAFGLRSVKDPECAVTADGWNSSLVDPTIGPLYVAVPFGAATNETGAYASGVGMMNAWLTSTWNAHVYLLLFRKNTTLSGLAANDFACYEDLGPTGTSLKSFTVMGSRTNCMAACMKYSDCGIVTTTSAFADQGYNRLSPQKKILTRCHVKCHLYSPVGPKGGSFVGGSMPGATVCVKLID